MAYDEALAARMREAVEGLPGLSEKRMMGGMCLMLDGNMLGGTDRDKTSGVGRFMFRVGKENAATAEARPEGEQMVMGGRVMGGMFFVPEEECTDAVLAEWMALALSFVRTLPPKDK